MLIEQDVLRFDVAVGNPMSVQVVNCAHYLFEDLFGFRLLEAARCFATDELLERVPSAILHHQIYLNRWDSYCFKRLDNLIQTDNIGVIYAA